MPSSLILAGGAAFNRTVKETVSQAGHSFLSGDVLRWDAQTSRYVKAQANNASNAEVIGVVSEVFDINSFELVYSGVIDITGFGGISLDNLAGVSAAPVLFLSSETSGKLEIFPPSAIGSVVKPVLTKNKSNSYVVNNFLGTQIGGSSTVAIDEIQPIGTIIPCAGPEVPVSWLPCDGSPQTIAEYSELYSRLCHNVGDGVPMYGYVIGITGAAYSSVQVNDIVHYKGNGIGNWTGTSPFDPQSNDEARARVISLPSATDRFLRLRIIPKYLNGQFTYPNIILKNGSSSSPNFNYRVWGLVSGVWTERPTSGFTVTDTSLTQFLTPDLRGRFALGSSTSGMGEGDELDTAFISSLGTYAMGSLGGEERHTLTAGEMPSHNHSATSTNQVTTEVIDSGHRHGIDSSRGQNEGSTRNETNNGAGTTSTFNTALSTTGIQVNVGVQTTTTIGSTGENIPHNNMPPYVTVRYIIKAKPYTRAAIIEGVEIPYANLLVRDLRSQILGGTSPDLGIYTNSGVGSGTLRMTVKGDTGRVGIAKTDPQTLLDVNGTGAFTGLAVGKTSLASGVALDIVGNLALTGKASSASTISTDIGSTLVTKDYVDGNAANLNMTTTTPFILPFAYTMDGWSWTLDDSGNFASAGPQMFHMPGVAILNSMNASEWHGGGNIPSTYATAVLPVGVWDICCFVFSNRGPGSGVYSDDDKYSFYRCFSARLVSTAQSRANVVTWLRSVGFGRTVSPDGSNGIANYRGHKSGNGFAVRVG